MSGIEESILALSTGPSRMRVVGAGPSALVLLPAVLDSGSAFGKLQWILRKHLPSHVASVAVDPPGYEGEDEVAGFETWTRFCQELGEVLQERFPGGLIFAGNSSGAVAATEAAVEVDTCRGLVWICWCDWSEATPHDETVLCPRDEPALRRLLELAWHQPPVLSEQARSAMLAASARSRSHVETFDAARHRERLSHYTGPLLLIHGESDGLVPPHLGNPTASARPCTEQVVFERCGHYPHRERPSDLARLLSDFARRCLAPADLSSHEGDANAVQSDR